MDVGAEEKMIRKPQTSKISVSLASAPDVVEALAGCTSITETVIAALRLYFGQVQPPPSDVGQRLAQLEARILAMAVSTPTIPTPTIPANADPFAGLDEKNGW